jgi:hypothetical protein
MMFINHTGNSNVNCQWRSTKINVYKTRKIIINGIINKTGIVEDHQQGNHQCVE